MPMAYARGCNVTRSAYAHGRWWLISTCNDEEPNGKNTDTSNVDDASLLWDKIPNIEPSDGACSVLHTSKYLAVDKPTYFAGGSWAT
eukprot:6198660-Pleurochrysis_carterae.AAC.1